ncbi:MAG: ABC transporter ATP-binding protein [Planctomycetota bacterium]
MKQARQEAEATGSFGNFVWASIAGVCVPALIVVVGVLAHLLDRNAMPPSSLRLGTHLYVPLPAWLTKQDARAQLIELVLIALAIAALLSLALVVQRRIADRRARRVIKSLHRRVMQQSLKRAEVEGAAAQQSRAGTLIMESLPQLGWGLALWFRTMPLCALILVGCVALALLVNVWLAVFAVISGVFLWQLYSKLRYPDWLELSRYEIPQLRHRLIALIGDGPMMGRVQADNLASAAFDVELESLDRRIAGDDARRARLWPALLFTSSIAIAVLVLGLGINSIGMDEGLTLPAALVLGLSLTGAGIAAGRLVQWAMASRKSQRACEATYLYLLPTEGVAPSEQRVGLAGLRDSIAFQNVTLNDSVGRPMLREVNLSFHPKTLVALMGTEEAATRSVVELIMGFGRPAQGEVCIDGLKLLDIHPMALAKNVMWVAPDGPLWEGSLTENLMAGVDSNIDTRDMVDVLERLGIYERITRLPEGLETLVGPSTRAADGSDGGSDLSRDVRYAIGIARAVLHRPPIVLANEPPAPTEHINEDPCLDCLRDLADSGSLVVMLPRRLKTLRTVDRVVLLNGGVVAGEGGHADLLNTSDLYRHLNYLLFNPYRHR